MKVLKNITGILAFIGFFIIIGTIGTDDLYTIELKQPHEFDFGLLLIGVLLIIPGAIVMWIDEKYYFDEEGDDT